ncbi:MLH3 [Symbiodinium sp. CCMP2592]|nr:MLH3 [Symbiodinium sp. CCMP2592]
MLSCIGSGYDWRLQAAFAAASLFPIVVSYLVLYRVLPVHGLDLRWPDLASTMDLHRTDPGVILYSPIVVALLCACPVDIKSMVLGVAFPWYIVGTSMFAVSAVISAEGNVEDVTCLISGDDSARPVKACILACMAASVMLNGFSGLVHLEFARKVRAAVPTSGHQACHTKRIIWRILAAACLLTLVAYFVVLIMCAMSRRRKLQVGSLCWGLSRFALWLIAAWLLALPHVATCTLLQGKLEHVVALLQRAEVVADLTAAFRACQDCRRRFQCFLVWHFVLDGLSLVSGLAADAVLVFGCTDFDMMAWNLGLNHPQLTAAFLSIQFAALVAFHESVEETVERFRHSSNDQAMFERLVLRRDELQLPVMGQVRTRRWFARAVLSSLLSTMITTARNLLKSLISSCHSPHARLQ